MITKMIIGPETEAPHLIDQLVTHAVTAMIVIIKTEITIKDTIAVTTTITEAIIITITENLTIIIDVKLKANATNDSNHISAQTARKITK